MPRPYDVVAAVAPDTGLALLRDYALTRNPPNGAAPMKTVHDEPLGSPTVTQGGIAGGVIAIVRAERAVLNRWKRGRPLARWSPARPRRGAT